MNICFKTISGKKYELELDPSLTIFDVKSILQDNYKFSGTISLLFKSKILDDSQTIGSLEIPSNSFIVIYTRQLPTKKKSDESIKVNNHENEKQEESNEDTNNLTKGQTNIEPSKYINSTPFGNLLTNHSFNDPPDFKEKIEQLKILGFEENDCENALRAALYQPDIAADYLVSGQIPDVPPKPLNLEEAMAFWQNREEEEEEENEFVGYLKDLIKLKELFERNPEKFPTYVSQLEESGHEVNQEYARKIRRDPTYFLYQLGLDPSKYDTDSVKIPTSKHEELMKQFNTEEKNAIHRIESNGFDTMTVIQVYIACDKDEELTTSCLISMRS